MKKAQISKIAWILTVLLALGLLAYSFTLFILNRSLPLPCPDIESARERLLWRDRAETTLGVCMFLWLLGHLLLIVISFKNRISFSPYKLFLYALTQISLSFVCTLPFSFFDPSFLADYLFPCWNVILVVIPILLLILCVRFSQKRI